MTVSFLNQSELIPGYVTVDRIGAGGYGEVFKVKAPGGLDKAIKVIYGYVNEERASRELKALNRIKEIRHPFLLSLERIEIVANQLLVVTELADQSLMERFQECRDEENEGIPRDELIEHMQDAAAALDYMLDTKELQHLDIKPENLLLVGGRVKVADFGLVKDVSDQVNTLMGGLTPVYASPEVFGGNASRQSDQYSLAIVFQQMLTSVLPFPGRTQQQLAIQHKQAEPRLSPLPKSDRIVVAKALAKEPTNRHESCKAFIDAVVKKTRTSVVVPAVDAPAEDEQSSSSDQKTTPQDNSDTLIATENRASGEDDPVRTETLNKRDGSKAAKFPTLPPSGVDAIQVSREIRHLPPVEIDTNQAELRPSLFIGIGGTGARVLQSLKHRLEGWDGFERSDAVQLLLLDTDADTIKAARNGTHGARIAHEEIVYLNLRRPRDYQERSADFLRWISRRWLYNIPRSLKTQGYRPLGRLAWVDHIEKIYVTIRKCIEQLVQEESIHALEDASGVLCNRSPRIIVVGSASGGTAGGMIFDMIVAVRHVLTELGMPDDGLCTVLAHSTNGNPRESTLASANTYSFLSELQHLVNLPHGESKDSRNPRVITSLAPLPTTYFMNLGDNLSEDAFNAGTRKIADYLYCNTATSAGLMLDRCRSLTPEATDGDLKLRSFGLSNLEVVRKELPAVWMRLLAQLVAKHWLESAFAVGDVSTTNSEDIGSPDDTSENECEGHESEHSPRPDPKSKLDSMIQKDFGDWFGSLIVERLKKRVLDDYFTHNANDDSASDDDVLAQLALKLSDASKQLRQLIDDLDLPRFAALRGLDLSQDDDQQAEFQTLDKRMLKLVPRLALELADVILADFLDSVVNKSVESDGVKSLDIMLQSAAQTKVIETVNRINAGHTMDDDGTLFPTAERIKQCYEASRVPLSGCGFAQRSFVVDRQAAPWLETNPTVKDLPLLPGPIDAPVICREAEQISLAQIAHGLTEGQPEIIEAADRLHIRADIRWSRPPAVCCEESQREEPDATAD